MSDFIKEGDKVIIRYEHILDIYGTILYTPCATGDSWRIRGEDGKIYYVNSFSYMVKNEDDE